MTERASALVTILFTDLVGSTELLSRAGDEEAQRIFRAHHDLLAETAAVHGGDEVKWLGDGLMVAFPSAADALTYASVRPAAPAGPRICGSRRRLTWNDDSRPRAGRRAPRAGVGGRSAGG